MTNNVYAPPQANVDASSPASTTPIEGQGITFDDLASAEKWRFMWGFFWRSICIALLSMLGGAVAGAIIGFVTTVIAQLLGKSVTDVLTLIRVLSGFGGLLVGFAALWLLVRWCFRANWFGYRLRLVRDVD